MEMKERGAMEFTFNENLLSLRKEHNLSQESLANELYVTRQTISKWETGEVTPDLAKIQSVADYFQVPVEEVLFGQQQSSMLTGAVKDRAKKFFEEDEADKDWHENHRWREWQYRPINNGWEFLARYYWILFALVGMIGWFVSKK